MASGGFSLVAELELLITVASLTAEHGLSGYNSQALEHRLRTCSPWACWPFGMWDLPESEIQATSPAPAGGLCTAEHQGSQHLLKVSKRE